METLDDGNRLVALHLTDRTGTKIDIGTERSRLGFACQPHLRAGVAVAETAVDGGLRSPEQGNRLRAARVDVMQLVPHHLGEQASPAIGRLHGDNRDGRCRDRSTGNRQPPAVRGAGGDPAPVDLEPEAASRLKHLAIGLPLRRHVIVMEAVDDRSEEFVEPLGCDVDQVMLG